MIVEPIYESIKDANIFSLFIRFVIFVIILHIVNDLYTNFKEAIAYFMLILNTIFNFLVAPLFYIFDFINKFAKA